MINEDLTPYLAGRPLATTLFVGGLAVWTVFEVRQAFNRRPNATPADRGSALTLRLCVIEAFVLAALASNRLTSAALPAGAATFGTGLLITWAGIGLRLWCFRTLGRYFTFSVMTSPDQRVIASGPYRVVRHPSYAGLLLILSGIAIVAYANWISLATVIVFCLAGLVYRIRVEEAALSSTLGQAYTSYSAWPQTPHPIPVVRRSAVMPAAAGASGCSRPLLRGGSSRSARLQSAFDEPARRSARSLAPGASRSTGCG